MTFVLLVPNQNQFSKYLDSLKNYTTILTIFLIGLKMYTSFVLTNRQVVLRGLINPEVKHLNRDIILQTLIKVKILNPFQIFQSKLMF